MALSRNQQWLKRFSSFEYFIVTNDAIVGVLREQGSEIDGWIVCARSGAAVDTKIKLNKQKVVKSLHKDALEIVQDIPEWYYSYDGFSRGNEQT